MWLRSSALCNACDGAVLGLVQEQRLEHVVVEVGMVETRSRAVRAEVQLQDLRLHDPLTWHRITTDTRRHETQTARSSDAPSQRSPEGMMTVTWSVLKTAH